MFTDGFLLVYYQEAEDNPSHLVHHTNPSAPPSSWMPYLIDDAIDAMTTRSNSGAEGVDHHRQNKGPEDKNS